MMKNLKPGLLIGTVFLFTGSFGQSNQKTAKTYLDLMVNVASTAINYGSSNAALADYKKTSDGIQAGISFQAGVTRSFSLVSELYFLKKGGKLKTGNPFSNNEFSLRVNTLELPVLARVHVGKFYMNAGPSIAYNLSGSKKIDQQSAKLSFNRSIEGFKRFDAGVQIGGGLEFPVKQKRIALDIRYSYGLTNIACGREMYNRALMISVHFSKPWKTNPLGRK